MRNEDWMMLEDEEYLREQAYLEAEMEWEYNLSTEENELLRREAKISILNKDLIVLDHDRTTTDILAF